ncbi:MAG: hypothetical protein DMF73_10275 [Acidobacteria bacterium]|nr:MAG: hypothetical protein DMF73_10275 [Acidobacteriota bacterium]
MKRSGHAKCKCRASKQAGLGISNLTVFLEISSEIQSQSFAFLNINTKYRIWFTAPKGSFYLCLQQAFRVRDYTARSGICDVKLFFSELGDLF